MKNRPGKGFPKPQHQTEGWASGSKNTVKCYIINPKTVEGLEYSGDIVEKAKSILSNQDTYKVGLLKGVPIYASKLIPEGEIVAINKGI